MISFPKEKINVLLLENIHENAFNLFKNDGFSVKLMKDAYLEDDLCEAIKDVHILGIRSKTNVTEKVFQNANKLLTLGCFCIGTNQVDLSVAEKKGIPVFNAPYSNTRSVAELVIAEIIFLARKTGDQSRDAHNGKWNKIATGCFEVRGKTLGIVGYGHIGSQVSILAESFGMKVIFYDIQTKLPLGNAQPVDTYEGVLKEADFLTFHVPESPDTMNLLGAKEIAKMKKGSYLLNLSRGRVVDIDALAAALKSGHLAGAGIDVFPEEPKSNKDPFVSPLQNIPNVILTPHIGGSTEEAQRNIGLEVANKLLRYINNGSTSFAVNFPNVELPLLKDNHRILNVHKNQPGFLKDINKVVSDLGANITAQFLSTTADIGYLIMDINKQLGDQVKEEIEKNPLSIKTRILY
ncbi:MAG TPA: phosphoglycerate dehydrogenase [Leptospiraceae bacterium]|nr:phosphoglycerate dehydrogenase [Leptospiraceae bacterium]HMW03656.1 phosphoglycerate dehydrogenase [Leptospiraceae bacterium]HMX31217.1 phosphoglycerate dehydrogenase [Leptospiraceae bacterium]HMY29423.1 phosphoglycerate dehydrogenase [Leptospiraceae bacterium]HMZ65833.1 phosphoglycerate dehydrogenase [Leptospiraceae bacterium]